MKQRILLGITVYFLVIVATNPIAEAAMLDNNLITITSASQEENDAFGFYKGLIIGRINNVSYSESIIYFYAASVHVCPGRYHFSGRTVKMDKRYFGLLTSDVICVIGTLYVGW